MRDSLIPEPARAGFACRSEGPSGNGRWTTIPNPSTVIRSIFSDASQKRKRTLECSCRYLRGEGSRHFVVHATLVIITDQIDSINYYKSN